DIGIDPIRDTLRADFQDSSNRSLAVAFYIHAQCQHARFFGMAFFFCHWGIGAFTFSALISLTPRVVEASLPLLPVCSTTWTFHPFILLPVLDTLFPWRNRGRGY